MKYVFWISLLLIGYTYFGYAILLWVWAKPIARKERVFRWSSDRTVSVVIAVHNEERNILKRIQNILEQDYPKDKVEIIIVSDGSKDSTSQLVEDLIGWGTNNLRLIHYKERRGKAYALNLGVDKASGEIIVFADGRQEFNVEAIRELVSNFNDPSVGCVSGELVFLTPHYESIKEEIETYWNYEKWVRKMESRIHSVPGATGAIYAIRRSLYTKVPDRVLLDDVYIPMGIVLKGYRAIFDGKAVAYDLPSKDFVNEKRRKVRTLMGNWQLLGTIPDVLNPFRNPICLQYLSHKVLRLLVPFCFIAYNAASLFLQPFFYRAVLIMTFFFFLLPIFEKKINGIKALSRLCKMSRAAYNLNYFALLGFIKFLMRKEIVW
jgi:cellulose synthase/poly-beta-1,6-N-acetylglucosamine synthase-like glycosyltransferase